MAALASFRVAVVVVGNAQGPATAQENQDWIAPLAFRDVTQGRVMLTLRTVGVTVFGYDPFLAGDNFIWQFPNGTCRLGRWQAVAVAICHDYMVVSSRSCLRYRIDNGGLVGHQWDMDRDIGDWPPQSVRLRAAESGALVCGGAPVS